MVKIHSIKKSYHFGSSSLYIIFKGSGRLLFFRNPFLLPPEKGLLLFAFSSYSALLSAEISFLLAFVSYNVIHFLSYLLRYPSNEFGCDPHL